MKNSQSVGKTSKSIKAASAAVGAGGKSVLPGKVARIDPEAETSVGVARKPAKAKRAMRSGQIAEAELQRMIREEAYFRAERRGFATGFEWQDWFEAEQDVFRQLKLESPTH